MIDRREIGHDPDTEPPDDEASGETDETDADLDPALVPLLPAVRAACDEPTREGITISRDALARYLRQNGHSVRNSAVSQLLGTLRRQAQSVIG